MNLVNELENDLALAFFVDKIHAEKIDSTEFVALLDRLREILEPEISDEDQLTAVVLTPIAGNVRAH